MEMGDGDENCQGSRIRMNWSLDAVSGRKCREVCGDSHIPGLGGRKAYWYT